MIAARCLLGAVPLLLCLGDGAWARRGERGVALPAGQAAVPALGPAELQWCITQERRIDQDQQAVDTAAAALRGRAVEMQGERGALHQEETAVLPANRAPVRSLVASRLREMRQALEEREAVLELDIGRSAERAAALAGIIAEYDSRCAGRSYLESDLRALQSPVGR